jgi:hypothetical protein
MDHIFEIPDKNNKIIYLPKERWRHIRTEHPYIINPDEIKKVLINPDKITESDRDETVRWYYLYNKNKKRYLKVSVKYLNNHGFVITAHFTTKIQ